MRFYSCHQIKKTYPERAVPTGSGVSMLLQRYDFIFYSPKHFRRFFVKNFHFSPKIHVISLRDAGSNGYYWGATPHSSDADYSYRLSFYSSNHGVNYNNRRDNEPTVRLVTE